MKEYEVVKNPVDGLYRTVEKDRHASTSFGGAHKTSREAYFAGKRFLSEFNEPFILYCPDWNY